MNILFRVLLAIYAFCLTILSVLSMVITLRPSIFYSISTYFADEVLQSLGTKLAMFIISLVFLVLSLIFLFSGFRSNKDKKSVSKYTNIGEVKISLNSMENIALSATRKLSNIRESKAYVFRRPESVMIMIKVVALPDTNIPSLSEDIQIQVKSTVEECTGINVSEVKVIVENIYTGYKSRVE